MPRKTPAELQEAKKEAQARREAEARARQERLNWLIVAKERTNQLQNVTSGLYDEFDKQARKWPTMPVTERQLGRVNKLLGAVRELLQAENDDFVEGLEDFVPAGDLPETRDVVLVLREANDALFRFERIHEPEWRNVRRITAEDDDDEDY
jgi:hypothetical protein